MNNELTPIETTYNGYRFRSRLEARWAVFFDAADIAYEYEPEGFELSGTGRYLPDFLLPDIDKWVEIKGVEPTEDERAKAIKLARGSGREVLLIIGSPEVLPVSSDWQPLVRFEEYSFFPLSEFAETVDEAVSILLEDSGEYGGVDNVNKIIADGGFNFRRSSDGSQPFLLSVESYHRAVRAFRSARFEHGEQG